MKLSRLDRITTVWTAALLLLGSALALTPAFGDSTPKPVKDTRIPSACQKVFFCENQSEDGACTLEGTTAGEKVSVPMAGHYTHTFYADRSTASSFTCDLFTASLDYDDAGGAGWKWNQVSLSPTQPVNWFTGGFDRGWVQCSGIAGGNVTIIGLMCPVTVGR